MLTKEAKSLSIFIKSDGSVSGGRYGPSLDTRQRLRTTAGPLFLSLGGGERLRKRRNLTIERSVSRQLVFGDVRHGLGRVERRGVGPKNNHRLELDPIQGIDPSLAEQHAGDHRLAGLGFGGPLGFFLFGISRNFGTCRASFRRWRKSRP